MSARWRGRWFRAPPARLVPATGRGSLLGRLVLVPARVPRGRACVRGQGCAGAGTTRSFRGGKRSGATHTLTTSHCEGQGPFFPSIE